MITYHAGVMTYKHNGQTIRGEGETPQLAADALLREAVGKTSEKVYRQILAPAIQEYLQS